MDQARDVYARRGYFATIFYLLGTGLSLHQAEKIVNQMRQEKIEAEELVYEFEVV